MAIRRWLAGMAVTALVVWSGGNGDGLSACGPFSQFAVPVNAVFPANPAAYARGELGIVQPRYARQYLAMAYRRFVNVAPPGLDIAPEDPRNPGSTTTASATPSTSPASTEITRWLDALGAVPGIARPDPDASFGPRLGADHEYFDNCGGDAIATATATLNARIGEFGATSAGVRDWTVAQNLVFRNCSGFGFSLPAAVAPGLPPVFTADRAYQTAAAYFYGQDFAKAEALFRAIAADRTSPWQPRGRYLAARSLIRRATLTERDAVAKATLARAEAELAGIIADPTETAMHAAAKSLRSFVEVRIDPVKRLHAVSQKLSTEARPDAQTFVDYSRLMDQLVASDVTFDDPSPSSTLIDNDDLTDWIVALQNQNASAVARAIGQWKAKQTLPWLIAALWRVDGKSPEGAALLTAAQQVPAASPAHATVVFLRARLLMARGDVAAARTVLDGAPDAPAPGFNVEAVNLLRSQRLRVATTFDEFLKATVRMPVQMGFSFEDASTRSPSPLRNPTFDVDAAMAFTEQLPLKRLAEAANSTLLPDRLRLKVAIAAWTRAVEFRDDAVGVAMAQALVKLSPALAADLGRYVAAIDPASRHNEAVFTLLHWPGLRNYVPLTEEYEEYLKQEPRHTLALEAVGTNWWASFAKYQYRPSGPYDWSMERPVTSLPDVADEATHATPPGFLTPEERVAAANEWRRLSALGSGPTYLASEAAAWATARPADPQVAEALALAVKATHYGNGDAQTGKASQQAFALLHKLFPTSAWAKQTPFWYEGR